MLSMPIFKTEASGVFGALPKNKKLIKSKGIGSYILISQLSSELLRKMAFAAKICIFKPHSLQEGYVSSLTWNLNKFQWGVCDVDQLCHPLG